MKNKKSLIATMLILALLLAGSTIMYGKLGNENHTNSLVLTGSALAENEQSAEKTENTQTADEEEAHDHETEKAHLAPDFTVYDADGNAVKLSSFFGKPIVLNFWASWCPPCRMEMPDFDQKYLEFGSDVHFLMTNMTTGRETKKSAQEFIEEQKFSFPVYFDTTQEATIAYQAFSLPTTYFINASGEVVAKATGAIDAQTLHRGIDMIMP